MEAAAAFGEGGFAASCTHCCSCWGAFAFAQRGKTVPEELVKPEELSKYRQVASHVVSCRVPANWEGRVPLWRLGRCLGWAASMESVAVELRKGPSLLPQCWLSW